MKALLALAAVAAFVLLLQRLWAWRAQRRRERARPRYPVVLAHGFMGFDEPGAQGDLELVMLYGQRLGGAYALDERLRHQWRRPV